MFSLLHLSYYLWFLLFFSLLLSICFFCAKSLSETDFLSSQGGGYGLCTHHPPQTPLVELYLVWCCNHGVWTSLPAPRLISRDTWSIITFLILLHQEILKSNLFSRSLTKYFLFWQLKRATKWKYPHIGLFVATWGSQKIVSSLKSICCDQ